MPFVGVVGVVDVEGVVVTAGGIPQFCSTQYEFPMTSLQFDPVDGF